MTLNKIRVADFIASKLSEAGASDVFMVTGGGAMHLNDAFARNKAFKVTCFHHEQGAAIAAEAYCRLSGKFAVLNVTSGPGGINALNGVFGAYVDSIGMVIVSGQVKAETYSRNYALPMRQLGDQEVDIVSMATPATKYAVTLHDPIETRAVVEKAIFLTRYGRPGPVWIDVPVDVQGALVNPKKLKGFNVNDLIFDPHVSENAKAELSQLQLDRVLDKECKKIVSRLGIAKRPVLFVGTGVRISGTHTQFLQLMERLNIPVVTGWNAHDLLNYDSPFYAGKPGTVGDRPGNFAVQNSDFLLVLGCRLNIRQISYAWNNFAPNAFKVMVDVDSNELEKHTLNIDLKVHARLQEFIPSLLSHTLGYAPSEEHLQYLKWCKSKIQKYPVVLPEYKNNKSSLNPYLFMDWFFKSIPPNALVIAGNGSACVIGFQAAKIRLGQRLFTNSGNASMGYDLPAAIGASIASGNNVVYCLAGDGSLMMNLQELQTMKHYKLPIKIIVINNNGYHSIRQTQNAYFPDNFVGVGPDDGVSFPDFLEVAKAFKIPSMRVSTSDGLQDAIFEDLFTGDKSALIEVMIDPSQNFSPKLASRKLDDGTMLSPSLEDMSPFLDSIEMLENKF